VTEFSSEEILQESRCHSWRNTWSTTTSK